MYYFLEDDKNFCKAKSLVILAVLFGRPLHKLLKIR
jgi:hypothetical protein